MYGGSLQNDKAYKERSWRSVRVPLKIKGRYNTTNKDIV